jgi:hypothetical protein
MRNPSGFCGMSSVSKSDFAFTVAASTLSATTKIRSAANRAKLGETLELREIGWRIAGAARRLRLDTHKPCGRKIQFIDEGG